MAVASTNTSAQPQRKTTPASLPGSRMPTNGTRHGQVMADDADVLCIVVQFLGHKLQAVKMVGWWQMCQTSKIFTCCEFAKWCGDTSKDIQFAIKTGKGNNADLEATIQKESANSDASKAKIDNAGSALRNENSICH